jgi:predicted Zn-dependent peptidase
MLIYANTKKEVCKYLKENKCGGALAKQLYYDRATLISMIEDFKKITRLDLIELLAKKINPKTFVIGEK